MLGKSGQLVTLPSSLVYQKKIGLNHLVLSFNFVKNAAGWEIEISLIGLNGIAFESSILLQFNTRYPFRLIGLV